MKHFRDLSDNEKKLLTELIRLSSMEFDIRNLVVCTSGNSGLYSLQLYKKHDLNNEERVFGKQVSEIITKDVDGVQVIISLYLDKSGELFEIDFWKADYSDIINMEVGNG